MSNEMLTEIISPLIKPLVFTEVLQAEGGKYFYVITKNGQYHCGTEKDGRHWWCGGGNEFTYVDSLSEAQKAINANYRSFVLKHMTKLIDNA